MYIDLNDNNISDSDKFIFYIKTDNIIFKTTKLIDENGNELEISKEVRDGFFIPGETVRYKDNLYEVVSSINPMQSLTSPQDIKYEILIKNTEGTLFHIPK